MNPNGGLINYLRLLHHTLPTANARWPIKGFESVEFFLVYFKRKNKNVATWHFLSSSDDVIKNTLTPHSHHITRKKVQTQKSPDFLKSNLGRLLLLYRICTAV